MNIKKIQHKVWTSYEVNELKKPGSLNYLNKEGEEVTINKSDLDAHTDKFKPTLEIIRGNRASEENEYIIYPYRKNSEISWDGYRIDPNSIKKIKTENPFTSVLDKEKHWYIYDGIKNSRSIKKIVKTFILDKVVFSLPEDLFHRFEPQCKLWMQNKDIAIEKGLRIYASYSAELRAFVFKRVDNDVVIGLLRKFTDCQEFIQVLSTDPAFVILLSGFKVFKVFHANQGTIITFVHSAKLQGPSINLRDLQGISLKQELFSKSYLYIKQTAIFCWQQKLNFFPFIVPIGFFCYRVLNFFLSFFS